MAKIILFPTHEGYCRTCAYSSGNGTCNNKKYNEHQYEVNCVWKYCPYRKEKLNNGRKNIEKIVIHYDNGEKNTIHKGSCVI